MDNNNRQGSFAVIAGGALIALGIWLVVDRLFGSALEPIRQLIHFMWSIAWPLALIGLGALILMRRESLRPTSSITGKRLYRSRSNRMVSGVIGGLADYLGLDATLLRILFALLTVAGGFSGVIVYIVASIIIPEEPLGSTAAATPPIPPVTPSPPVWPVAHPAPVPPTAPASTPEAEQPTPESPAPNGAFTPPTN